MPTDDHALVNKATWDEDARNWIQRGRAQPYWVPVHEHKDEVSGGVAYLTPALHAGAREASVKDKPRAGSIVTKDLPSNVVAVGKPARIARPV